MYLKKYITILVVIYFSFYQVCLNAEIERRTNPDRFEIFQKLGPWVGLIPGTCLGSGIGMFKVTKASFEVLWEYLRRNRPEKKTLANLLKEAPPALFAFNVVLLTGAVQGAVYGGYAGLLLGAGYGINLDKRLYKISKYINLQKDLLWVDNQDQRS